MSFQDVSDLDIAYVEEITKRKFFMGEKKLIAAMVKYVKKVANGSGSNEGLQHFTINRPSTLVSHVTSNESQTETQTHFFLNKLLAAANQNSHRKPGGYRYEPDIKLFSSYLRMLVGPLAYETLQRNLECALPSLSSVNRYIQNSNCDIIEGILRCDELKMYLAEREVTDFCVCLSEDATRIQGKVEYHHKTNQLVGFVLPTNAQNGLPIPFTYRARNFEEIFQHFSGGNTIATFLNVVMAQPTAKNIPAFCLLIFGSDNRYSAQDVVKRWKYVSNELKKRDIRTLTFSSDSDPRYNAPMRELSNLGLPSPQFPDWFSCGELNDGPFSMQDTVHIATKLRNFLLRTCSDKKALPFGTHFIRVEHLFELLNKCSKDKHLLTASTLNPTDRQNFDSVKKMCSPAVVRCLRENVTKSEATVLFLQIVRDIIDAYMDPNLNPVQRIRKMWYANFLVRI